MLILQNAALTPAVMLMLAGGSMVRNLNPAFAQAFKWIDRGMDRAKAYEKGGGDLR